jgi:ABC-type siderophore export system fused ATPase/permease subunit
VSGNVACIGGDAYLKGLCQVHGWAAPMAVHSVQESLAVARDRPRTVAVVEAHDLNEFESQYLSALVAALRTGVVQRLTLVFDEWRIDIDPWRLRRFWRGALPMSKWGQA